MDLSFSDLNCNSNETLPNFAVCAWFTDNSSSVSGEESSSPSFTDNFKSGSETCCAKFNNDGKTYDANSMVTTQEGKQMSITMTFKRMTVFNNTYVTLTVNGQQVNVPIELMEIAHQLSGYKLLIP